MRKRCISALADIRHFICDDRQSMAGCEVVFGTKKPALSYKLLNEDGLVENEAHEMKLDESKVTVTEDFFDKDAYIFENIGCREVSIQADGKAAVTVTFDAPVFGLWSPVGKKKCRLSALSRGTAEPMRRILTETFKNVTAE